MLDAIGAALGPTLEMPTTRPDFKRSPRTVVRRGARYARVTCWLRFSPDEVAATRELFQLRDIDQTVPEVSEVKLIWEYPDPLRTRAVGFRLHALRPSARVDVAEKPNLRRSSAGNGAG